MSTTHAATNAQNAQEDANSANMFLKYKFSSDPCLKFNSTNYY